MSSYDFMVKAKKAVCDWLCEHYKAIGIDVDLTWTDVFVVWSCKTIQNHKAILGAPTPDRCIFECTYNGDKDEMYVDVYEKIDKLTLAGLTE